MNGSQMMTSLDCSNNNGCPSLRSRIPQPRQLKINDLHGSKESVLSPRAIFSPRETMSLSRTSSREDVQGWTTASIYAERWKTKYQEADRKCKGLLVKNEKTLREHNELERRYQLLQENNDKLEYQLMEKDTKLNKLRAISEKVYKEYEQLKNQHEVDKQTHNKVMESAGQWYQQNRKLKRKSAAIMQRLPLQVMQDWESLDATDAASESSGGEELDGLRETVAELSNEIARLQTEISSLKLQEFETTELNVNLMQELESEKINSKSIEERLQHAIEEIDRNKRLARHLATEVSSYRDQLEQYKNQATIMRGEAESARKERDVLAHRSSIYLETLPENGEYGNGESEILLKELENLRVQVEEERIQHAKEMDELQEKLLDKENSDEMFILEEKLNLAEDDVRKAIERAEKAEKLLEEHENKRRSIMTRVALFENSKESKMDTISSITTNDVNIDTIPAPPIFSAPPPPPPPVPPPPPPMPFNDAEKKSTSSAIADMAALLGLKQKDTEKKKPTGGAIDEIINQIKGGRFQLKSTEQKVAEKKPKEEPAALQELRNILGTLKRRPKSSKESNKENTEKNCS